MFFCEFCQPYQYTASLKKNPFTLLKYVYNYKIRRLPSNQNMPINNTTSANNNNAMLRRQRRRRKNRVHRMHNIQPISVPINNQNTLNIIENLSRQVTNDPLIDQLFNGSLFY